MSPNRETVLLVMFDLSLKTKRQRREYRRFRSTLLKQGFSLLQNSVYYKLLSNVSSVSSQRYELEQFKPRVGNVQLLPLPLNVFRKLESMVGPPFEFEKILSPVLEFCDDDESTF